MDRFLNSNAFLRVIALVMACVLWLSVNAPGNSGGVAGGPVVKSFPYPVRVQVSPDMTVTSIDNPTVMVEIVTDAVNVSSLTAQMLGVSVVADARGLSAGRHELRLAATGMPPVRYSIDPPVVTVSLEHKVVSVVDVQVTTTGKPASGYEAGPATADLQAAQVSGAQSAVAQVDHLEAAVPIDGAKAAVTRTVELKPVTASGAPVAGVEVNPPTGTVTVQIRPKSVTAHLVPEIRGSPADGYAVAGVRFNPADVRLRLGEDAAIGIDTVQVPVDVSGLTRTTTWTVHIPLPAGASSADPSAVTVTVEVDKSAQRTFHGLPMTVTHVPAGLRASAVTPATVDLTVTGPATVVDRMADSSLHAYVDASGLAEGTHTLTPKAEVPEWVRVSDWAPSAVQVQLQPVRP